MSDVRIELISLYKDYIEYLGTRIDEAVESSVYQDCEEWRGRCINALSPKLSERRFGPFRWTVTKYPSSEETQQLIERITWCEQRQRDIVDQYCPDPSFESFMDWLAQPKLRPEVVEKFKNLRNR